MSDPIAINRAPVLTLWAAVVAERLGFDWNESLTLGRAVAGLNAQSKGRRLGIFSPGAADEKSSRARKDSRHATEKVELLGRAVPVVNTPHGIRAAKDGEPESPESVERYLEGKFGESLGAAREAMTKLAKSFRPEELGAEGFRLYEEFRPQIPAGTGGWGAKGVLDLARVTALAKVRKSSR